MKKLFTLLTCAFGLVVASHTSSFAQAASASAAATATIVQPIAISKTADMAFGNIAVSTTAGTVVIAPSGSRSATGGVTLPALGGSGTAASFSVTGSGNYTYSITLPSSSIQLTSAVGNNHMTISTFTSTPSSTGTLASGAQTLNVGATLAVAASQPAGTYTTDANFVVQVAYN